MKQLIILVIAIVIIVTIVVKLSNYSNDTSNSKYKLNEIVCFENRKATILHVSRHEVTHPVYYYNIDWIDDKGTYNHAYISGHRLTKCE